MRDDRSRKSKLVLSSIFFYLFHLLVLYDYPAPQANFVRELVTGRSHAELSAVLQQMEIQQQKAQTNCSSGT